MLENAEIMTSLPCKDIERARTFYQEKLGFSPVEERDNGPLYESGGAKFFLYESPSAGSNQSTAACFNVKDVRSCVADLKSRGVEFEHYDDIPGVNREGDIHTNDSGFQCSWFKDSEDNILSVTQSA